MSSRWPSMNIRRVSRWHFLPSSQSMQRLQRLCRSDCIWSLPLNSDWSSWFLKRLCHEDIAAVLGQSCADVRILSAFTLQSCSKVIFPGGPIASAEGAGPGDLLPWKILKYIEHFQPSESIKFQQVLTDQNHWSDIFTLYRIEISTAH